MRQPYFFYISIQNDFDLLEKRIKLLLLSMFFFLIFFFIFPVFRSFHKILKIINKLIYDNSLFTSLLMRVTRTSRIMRSMRRTRFDMKPVALSSSTPGMPA